MENIKIMAQFSKTQVNNFLLYKSYMFFIIMMVKYKLLLQKDVGCNLWKFLNQYFILF